MTLRAPHLLFGALLLFQASACSSKAAGPKAAPGDGGGGGGGDRDSGGGGDHGSAGSGGSSGNGGTGGSPGSGVNDAGSGAGGGTGGMADAAPDAAGIPPPAGIPAGYKLLLDEPFTSADSISSILAGNPQDWSHGTDAGGYLQYGGAGYSPPNPPVPDSLTSFALVSAMKFGSFVLEVELMSRNPDQAAPQRDMCIVFNIKSDTEYYFAHIAQGHSERFHNIHLINNAPRLPITETQNGGIRWGLNQWHKVRLVRDVVSGSIAVYWDDDLANPVLTAADTTLTEGYVGFGTHEDPGRIRNLKVWADSAVSEPAPANFFR